MPSYPTVDYMGRARGFKIRVLLGNTEYIRKPSLGSVGTRTVELVRINNRIYRVKHTF